MYLWGLIVHGQHGDVEADPGESDAQVVGDGQDKLDLLGAGADVFHRGHVAHLHEVHGMLERMK